MFSYERASFDDIELMQYTGLKDKNHLKIYEGDIVKFEDELYKVIYDTDECRFLLVDEGDGTRVLGGWRSHLIEVIGNIYENPELLEKTPC